MSKNAAQIKKMQRAALTPEARAKATATLRATLARKKAEAAAQKPDELAKFQTVVRSLGRGWNPGDDPQARLRLASHLLHILDRILPE